MNFKKIAELFQNLENRKKRLEKILVLRDFLTKNPKDSSIIFDIIAGNLQRQLDKKTLAISTKTIFIVFNFLSKINEKELNKIFNKLGDIGKLGEEIFTNKKQTSLFSNDTQTLTLNSIIKTLQNISNTKGTNANKKKQETLSNLFLLADSSVEYKFLARLLISDLRIGVSEGVLKEACVNAYFPKILNIHSICHKCGYINLNLDNCFKCQTKIDSKKQEEYISKKYSIIELETPKKETSLLTYKIEHNRNNIEFALRRNKQTQILKTDNQRELYNKFLNLFEKKYNILNSFQKTLIELDKNLSNVMKFEIIIGNPIKSMLGTRAKNVKESFEMTSKPAFLDFKYDGLRVQIHNNYGKVKLFSRNLEEITKQFPEIIEFIKLNFSDTSFVIDSECIAYDFEKQVYLPFQTLSKRILTKKIKDVKHINIAVKSFDILYLNNKTLIDLEYIKRREILEKLLLNRKLKQRLYFDVKNLKEK